VPVAGRIREALASRARRSPLGIRLRAAAGRPVTLTEGAGREVGTLTPAREGSGPESWGRHRWHSDGANLYPRSAADFDDLPKLIREFVVPGHAPKQPLLSRDDDVVTLGSCFAAELRDFLGRFGFSSSSLWVPSGLNNTFALADFVSWCVTGEQTNRGYRYDLTAEGRVEEWTPEGERTAYLERLRAAGAFVFTIGLAEVWQDRETGGVFWRGVPRHIFDSDRHVFRLTTVEENEANVVRIVELIREVNAGAPIVLTLSPVPLKATFRDISCVTADAVSKSVLRVALDSALRRDLPGVWYWPSYEIVKWAGAHLPWPAYGLDDGSSRHVTRYLVVLILEAFVEAFYGAEAAGDFTARLEAAGMRLDRPIPVFGRTVRA
jgi:antitoxin (DNA-binding transcriptional repressor) of toxin-antitoxin stability system